MTDEPLICVHCRTDLQFATSIGWYCPNIQCRGPEIRVIQTLTDKDIRNVIEMIKAKGIFIGEVDFFMGMIMEWSTDHIVDKLNEK